MTPGEAILESSGEKDTFSAPRLGTEDEGLRTRAADVPVSLFESSSRLSPLQSSVLSLPTAPGTPVGSADPPGAPPRCSTARSVRSPARNPDARALGRPERPARPGAQWSPSG